MAARVHFTICAVLVLLAGTTSSLEYSALEMLGMTTCPTKDSCTQIGDASFAERNCECDSECGVYGDCCIDAPRFPVFNRHTLPRQTCLPHDNLSEEGTFVVISCPRNYSGPTLIRQQCQMNNFSDPLMSTPVTDVSNGMSYLNRYCAMCNDAFEDDLRTWTLSCRLKSQASLDLIVYRRDLHMWGVEQDGLFEPCQFRFDRPSDVTGGFRDCRSNLTSTCQRPLRSRTLETACKSYMSVVVDDRDRLYKNPHCAVCNGVRVDDIECFSLSVNSRKAKPFSFALLLDVNTSDGDVVGVSARCPSGQMYDPYFKKCRTLTCAIPGFKLVNGKCVQQ